MLNLDSKAHIGKKGICISERVTSRVLKPSERGKTLEDEGGPKTEVGLPRCRTDKSAPRHRHLVLSPKSDDTR